MRRFALALCVTTVFGGMQTAYSKHSNDIEGQRKGIARSIPLTKPANDFQSNSSTAAQLFRVTNNFQISQNDSLQLDGKRAKSLRKLIRKEERAKRKLARKMAKLLRKQSRHELKKGRKMRKLRAKAQKRLAKQLRKRNARALKRFKKLGIPVPAYLLGQVSMPAQTHAIRTVAPVVNYGQQTAVPQPVSAVRAVVAPQKKENEAKPKASNKKDKGKIDLFKDGYDLDEKKLGGINWKDFITDNNNIDDVGLFNALPHQAQIMSLATDIEDVSSLLQDLHTSPEEPHYLSSENLENFIDAWDQLASAHFKIGILGLSHDDEKVTKAEELKESLHKVGNTIVQASLQRVKELKDYVDPLRGRLFSVDEDDEEKTVTQILLDVNTELDQVRHRVTTFCDTFEYLRELMEGTSIMFEFPALEILYEDINEMTISAGVAIQRLELLKENYMELVQEEVKRESAKLTSKKDTNDEEVAPTPKSEKKDEHDQLESSLVAPLVLEMKGIITEAQKQVSQLMLQEDLDFGQVPTWYSIARKNLVEIVEKNMDALGSFHSAVNALMAEFSLEQLRELLSISASVLDVKDVNIEDLGKYKMRMGWINDDLRLVKVKASEESLTLEGPSDTSLSSSTRLEVNTEQALQTLMSVQQKLLSLRQNMKAFTVLEEDRSFLATWHRNLFADFNKLIESNEILGGFKQSLELFRVSGDEDFRLDKLSHLLDLGKSILEFPHLKIGDLYHVRERLIRIEKRLAKLLNQPEKHREGPASGHVSTRKSEKSGTFKVYEDPPEDFASPEVAKPTSKKEGGLRVRSNNIQSASPTVDETKRRQRTASGIVSGHSTYPNQSHHQ